VCYGSGGRARIDIQLSWNPRWGPSPNFKSLHRYNWALSCSISLKFYKRLHRSAESVQWLKSVHLPWGLAPNFQPFYRNYPPWIAWFRSNVEGVCYGFPGVCYQIALTQPRIVRFRSNSVQSLIVWQQIHFLRARSKGQSKRSQRDVTYQRWKRFKSGMDRPKLTDFKLGESAVCNMLHKFKVKRSKFKVKVT